MINIFTDKCYLDIRHLAAISISSDYNFALRTSVLDILKTVHHAGQAEAGPEEGEAEDGAEGPGHQARGAGGVGCYVALTVWTLDSRWLRSQLWHGNLLFDIAVIRMGFGFTNHF